MANRDRTYISRDEFDVFERNVDRSFANVTEAINALTGKIDRMGATDWRVYCMFAGLVLTIAGLAAQPYVTQLWRLEEAQRVDGKELREEIRRERTLHLSPLAERLDRIEREQEHSRITAPKHRETPN